MHILITGANGFIGQSLVNELLSSDNTNISVTSLSLIDQHFAPESFPESPKLKFYKGSFADTALIQTVLAEKTVDLVFHLASVPSGMAESNHDLGMQVNVDGMINLLDLLHAQGNIPKVVFASSIAVYGKPAPPLVDENTLPSPLLSYGYQKLIGEHLIALYSHKNWIDGCSIRLPGIVTRPPQPNGAVSIFFSDLIRNLTQQRPFICPVSAKAKSWLMSIQCCVDNLLLASQISFKQKRTWTLPALYCSIDNLVKGISSFKNNSEISELITYEVDPWVEENFGSYPPLTCPQAEEIGFKHDKNIEDLIRNSL